MELVEIVRQKRIACPVCRGLNLQIGAAGDIKALDCGDCGEQYQVLKEIPLMLPPETRGSGEKEKIQEFWGELFRTAYSDHDQQFTRDNLKTQLSGLLEMFQTSGHLAATEMPVDRLAEQHVLEIGCGAGAHSALFSELGASMTSLDITLERVVETSRKLQLVDDESRCFALQGDSESMPFPDNHFDIVYSNGVLHHTYDTQKAVTEVMRVLRPGGTAVIMLYAKESFYYWVANFLVQGVLRGNIFRHRNWLGRATEWMGREEQQVLNPETKVFSRREIQRMFAGFASVSSRKNGFIFQQIPGLGKYVSRGLGYFTGYDPAGTLVYDQPWRKDTGLELWLGKYIGFAHNIRAVKQDILVKSQNR